MQTIGGVRRSVDHEIHLRWQHIRSWTQSVFSRERMTEFVLLSCTLTLCAFVVFCLHKAVQTVTIMPHLGGAIFPS